MKLADWLAAQVPPMKQVEFRRRVGIGASHMSRLLSGERKPDVDLAAKIEDATGGAVGLKDWADTPSASETEEGAGPARSAA